MYDLDTAHDYHGSFACYLLVRKGGGKMTKYQVGDEVKVEFMGTIVSVELANGLVTYDVVEEQGKAFVSRAYNLKEGYIYTLPQEEDFNGDSKKV